jgi:hypothetical protein
MPRKLRQSQPRVPPVVAAPARESDTEKFGGSGCGRADCRCAGPANFGFADH